MQFDPKHAILLNAFIHSDEFVFEPLTRNHAEKIFPLLQAPEIYEWISLPQPTDLAKMVEAWTKCERRLSRDGTHALLNWVIKRVSDSAYIGMFDVDVSTENVAINVGYVFFPQHWGKGYASRALGLLVKHLKQNKISTLIAIVTRGNLASYRVLEKAGFKQSRIIPDNDLIRGIKYDDVEYIRE